MHLRVLLHAGAGYFTTKCLSLLAIPVVLALGLNPLSVVAEQPILSEFKNGVVIWSNSAPTGYQCIEWANSVTGQWHHTWKNLLDIRATGGMYQIDVPLFYRVVWDSIASTSTPADLPPNVSSFSATVGDNSVGLLWNNPSSGNFSGVRIMKTIGWYPVDPSDGIRVFEGRGNSYYDVSVVNGTRYYYTAFSYNSDGAYSLGISASALPVDNTPPNNVSGFQAIEGDKQVILSWENPLDSDFAGVKVVRSTSGPPTTPTSGTSVYVGLGTSVIDGGLANGTVCYYRAFSFDTVPNYSSGRPAFATPVNSLPPDNVTSITAAIGDQRLIFNWVNPMGGDFLGVRVIRKAGTSPTNVNDGISVYDGNGRSFTNSDLVNGTVYFYSFYSYDEIPNYSSGIITSGVPADLIPPSNATALLTIPVAGNIQLSWTMPLDADLAGARLVRKTSGYPTNSNDGTVVYVGADTNAYDSGLVNGTTTNYYRLFCFDEVLNYSSGTNATFIPPVNVTGFRAAANDERVELSWTNPITGFFSGVRIQRKTLSMPSNALDGTTIYQGTGSCITNLSLTNLIQYFYGAFTYDNLPNYSGGAFANTTPADILSPDNVTNLIVISTNQAVVMQWTNPSNDDFAGVLIQQREDRLPTNFNDGITVYSGSGSAFTNAGLSNGTSYYYRVIAYDEVPNYASGIGCTCMPLRVAWTEDFEDSSGWTDHTSNRWVQTANSGNWSSDYPHAVTDVSKARSGSRMITHGANYYLYLPPTDNPIQLRLWVRGPADGQSVSVDIYQYNGYNWYSVDSASTRGTTYSNLVLNINLPSQMGQRLRLYFSPDAFLDDFEMRVAP